MTDYRRTDWRQLVGRLADELIADGVLTDREWIRAFTAVPRHAFVPGYYVSRSAMVWEEASAADGLASVYRDDTLVTQVMTLVGQGDSRYASSSSTRPSLMLMMLQLLDVSRGMRVLEVGTGTGYNAALLSERLGSGDVTSIDIDDGLVTQARRRLDDVGYRPTLATCDGQGGFPPGAPYDRILATVAFEDIPYAWVSQTKPGGIILADLRPPGMIQAGALALLTVSRDGTATGRLIDVGPGFMSARTDPHQPAFPQIPVIDKRTVYRRTSNVSPELLDQPGLALAVWRQLPGIAVFPMPGRLMLTIPDGSWAEVTRTQPAAVEHGGPADIWAIVERVTGRWLSAGSPALGSYLITVTESGADVLADAGPSSDAVAAAPHRAG